MSAKGVFCVGEDEEDARIKNLGIEVIHRYDGGLEHRDARSGSKVEERWKFIQRACKCLALNDVDHLTVHRFFEEMQRYIYENVWDRNEDKVFVDAASRWVNVRVIRY